jgi:hypothetical protein
VKRGEGVDLEAVKARIKERGASALLQRGEAAALITERIKGDHEEWRLVQNRVAMQLARARERGDDVRAGGLAVESNDLIRLDELGTWAQLNYRGLFDDLPNKPREFINKCHDNVGTEDSSDGLGLPGSLEAAHDLIARMHKQIKRMQASAEAAEEARKRELASRFYRNKVNTDSVLLGGGDLCSKNDVVDPSESQDGHDEFSQAPTVHPAPGESGSNVPQLAQGPQAREIAPQSKESEDQPPSTEPAAGLLGPESRPAEQPAPGPDSGPDPETEEKQPPAPASPT